MAADLIITQETPMSSEDVIVRAVQFFSGKSWRATSQSSRAVTFQGRIPFPWFHVLLTFLGFLFCIVPGIILYFLLIRKAYRFQNLVVTANPMVGGSQVSITYPSFSKALVQSFVQGLPKPVVS